MHREFRTNPGQADQAMNGGDALCVLPSLRAGQDSDGRIVLTRKFIDGAAAYARLWPGPVVVCAARRMEEDSNLDLISVDAGDLPFVFQWREDSPLALAEQVRGARLVLASLIELHTGLAPLCRRLGLPLVYVAEHDLQTRRQMIRSETANPLLRWRRELWSARVERRLEQSVRLAAGVQCNGMPAYEAYRTISPRALLYFDTRVRRDMLAPPELVQQRTSELLNGGPLRLAFSGRLIRLKGADHLLPVAAHLKRMHVPFTLDICGGGALEGRLRAQIRRFGLSEQVTLRGVMDFHRELMPFITRRVDLFVCCHRQGDPSCTYLETMSCGTPIAGYDNGAFRGLVRTSSVGWLSPLDQPERLARRIARLNNDRAQLAHAATAALQFAQRHTFEDAMRRRVEHMLACCDQGRLRAAS
jgi:colanic acid/amylovoran biosynthesis glycosyltransferase